MGWNAHETLDVAKMLLGYSNNKKDDEQPLLDKEAYEQIGILGNAIAVPHALWIFKSIVIHTTKQNYPCPPPPATLTQKIYSYVRIYIVRRGD